MSFPEDQLECHLKDRVENYVLKISKPFRLMNISCMHNVFTEIILNCLN